MTDHRARVKDAAYEINVRLLCALSIEAEQDLYPILTALCREVERETWETFAKQIRRDTTSLTSNERYTFGWYCMELIKRCEQQATQGKGV